MPRIGVLIANDMHDSFSKMNQLSELNPAVKPIFKRFMQQFEEDMKALLEEDSKDKP